MQLLNEIVFYCIYTILYVFILVNQYMYFEFIYTKSNSEGKACYMQLFGLTCTDPVGSTWIQCAATS